MARKQANFFDLHAEKLTLGLCAVLLVGSAVYSLGGGRFAVNDLGPGALCEAVGNAADQTRSAVQNARPPSASAENDPARAILDSLQNWFGPQRKGLAQVADVAEKLPRAMPFHAPYVPVSAANRHNLAPLVAPDVPVVAAGEGTFEFPEEKPPLDQYNGRPPTGITETVTLPYVSVAAQLDLVTQAANFITERYPDGSYLLIASVELQRKDMTNPRRGWEDVEVFLPYQPLERPKPVEKNGKVVKYEGVDDYQRLLDLFAGFIARPRLFGIGVELPAVPYLDEPPVVRSSLPPDKATSEATKRVNNWIDTAKKALAGRRPFDEPNLDAAYVLARAAAGTIGAEERARSEAKDLLREIIRKMPRQRRSFVSEQARVPERIMPIMAHDLSAEPGHTYVYRLRYEAFNVFVGNRGELIDPADAERLTLVSDWSPPSMPVTIEGDTYFYLTDANQRRGQVQVTVFSVSRRGAAKQEYRIGIGDEIGRKERRGRRGDFDTGAVCIDIDFDRRVDGKKDVSMVYLDAATGAIRERLLSLDRNNPKYRELANLKTASR